METPEKISREDDYDVKQHFVELPELFDRLSCAGLELEVPPQVAMIYRSLPKSFGSLKTALESCPDGDQTIELVKQKLMDDYQRRSERSSCTGENALQLLSAGRKKKHLLSLPKSRSLST